MRTYTATHFKTHCLAILDEVATTGEPVTIVKRGRPVGQLFPAVASSDAYPQKTLRGTVRTLGDVVSPVLSPSAWKAERPRCR